MIISFDTFGAWATAVKEAKQEQEKNITITENGTGSVLPDSGKTLSKVDYTVNVPMKEEQTKSVTITENGTGSVLPDSGKTLSKVDYTVDVHPTEKLTTTITENGTTNLTGEWKDAAITVAVPQKEEQTKSVTLTTNGTTTVSPDAGKVLSSVAVTVNVAGGATKVDVGALGIKLGCSTFTKVPDIYDFSNCTDMYDMFYWCTKLTTVPQMDTSKVTDMQKMFYRCSSLTSLPELDTSNCTDMSSMFYYCTSLTSLPVMDTSKVMDMRSMFSDCTSLTSLPELDTSRVTNMGDMFYYCTSLTSLPVMDTSKVMDMQNMFNGCTSLTSLPVMDTSKVTNMYSMFDGCSSLTSLTLVGSLNARLSIYHSPLNEESIKSVLTAASKTTNTTAKTLTFKTGSTFTDDAEGTWAALVADCTTKGWTIKNLTITPAA